MECIHLVHPRKYNVKEKKWTRAAFRNNKGSLSIIGCNCVEDSGLSLCEHIRKFYGAFTGIASDPPVFWQFDTEHLPHGGNISPDGAPERCHFIVNGLNDERLWGHFEPHAGVEALSHLSICNNSEPRQLKLEDVIAIKSKAK